MYWISERLKILFICRFIYIFVFVFVVFTFHFYVSLTLNQLGTHWLYFGVRIWNLNVFLRDFVVWDYLYPSQSLSRILILMVYLSSLLLYLHFSWIFSHPSGLICLCSRVVLPVSLASNFTLLSLPAACSGLFQTFGACQELPGLAHLSSSFIPPRSDTGTRSSVSSQQQLPKDQIAVGLLGDFQAVAFHSSIKTFAVFWLFNE